MNAILKSRAAHGLNRRVIACYFAFCLTSVLICLGLALALRFDRVRLEQVPLFSAGVLAVLIAGAYTLYRTLDVTQQIDSQLRLCAGSPGGAELLQPVPAPDLAASGWNGLLQQLREASARATLDARLCEDGGSADEKSWRSVFNAFPDGIAVCGADESIVLANNAFLAMFGHDSPGQLVGRHLPELLQEMAAASSKDVLVPAPPTRAPITMEIHRGTDLASGVWRATRVPILDEAYESGRSFWMIRDVTQQKIAEEMRNQFVYTATHELRTPLTNIKAYAETLAMADDLEVSQQKNFYNIINQETTRLTRFVNQLLDVSQIEAGAATIIRSETDTERLVHEVVENMRPNIDQKQLKFESQLPAKLPKIRVDKDKFAAALINLLSNAVKYTPEGGTVRLIVEVDDGQIDFHVEDTGYGIAAEELPQLCEKFFRSRDERVQKVTGSGLGLAFSDEVARRHGGKILVRSELDKGSRFTLTMPLN